MAHGGIRVELVGGVPVVAVPEEVDSGNALELRSSLLTAVTDAHGTLVADMTRTGFCASAGLGALIAAHRRAQAEGGELVLVVSAAAVLRKLEITGIDRMITTFTRLDDALAHISRNRSTTRRWLGKPCRAARRFWRAVRRPRA